MEQLSPRSFETRNVVTVWNWIPDRGWVSNRGVRLGASWLLNERDVVMWILCAEHFKDAAGNGPTLVFRERVHGTPQS
jgi:hypothetical protein